MEFRRKIRKVGNSLVLTLPKKITLEKNIAANQEVVIVSTNLGIGIFHEGWIVEDERASVTNSGSGTSEDVPRGRATPVAGEAQLERAAPQAPRSDDGSGRDVRSGGGRVPVVELEHPDF